MNNKAFTLIELLVVIGILALIFAFLIPKLNNVIENSKENAFAYSVRSMLQAADTYVSSAEYTGAKPSKGEGVVINLSTLVSSGYLKSSSNLTDSVVVFYNQEGDYKLFAFATDGTYIIDGYTEDYLETHVQKNSSINYVSLLSGITNFAIYNSETKNKSNSEYNHLAYYNPIVTDDTSGANAPILFTGMIPVYWDETNQVWRKADSLNPTTEYQWYNYSGMKWANAVTTTSDNRATYVAAGVGTIIPMSDINTMWVWIPRYEYKMGSGDFSGGNEFEPGFISINFISKNTTSPTSGYHINSDFTFGTINQSGIWVSKFDTSGTISSITVKPNLTILTNINLSTMFNAARDMEGTYNNFGFNSSELDVHMMKSGEWGAAAYLSQSIYGKRNNSLYPDIITDGAGTSYREIYINNNRLGVSGCSGGNPWQVDSSSCDYTYNQYKYGTGASTTGNIYGVYDMSGGMPQAMMAGVTTSVGSSGFVSLPDLKYYDVYTNLTATNITCSGSVCYGHALSETEYWYEDHNWDNVEFFDPDFDEYFLYRETYSTWKSEAGPFSFDAYDGAAETDTSFRITITSET